MEIQTKDQTKGTRILFGEEAVLKRNLINSCVRIAENNDFKLMILPVLQFQETFKDKVGDNKHMMYNFQDNGGRDLCLAPEYTAIVQKLASTQFKFQKDVRLFYIQECFRGEKPQAGRYRQFTQFGVEILNPTAHYEYELITMASEMIKHCARNKTGSDLAYEENAVASYSAKRGLDYYKAGEGFEISWDSLGAQKQICGGGAYENGIGFALGIDRLMLV